MSPRIRRVLELGRVERLEPAGSTVGESLNTGMHIMPLLRSLVLNLLIVLPLSLAPIAAADDKATPSKPLTPLAAKDYESPTVALDTVQAAHAKDASTFVLQNELDGLIDENGGGACASAVAIDLLQTLRVMSGTDKLPNPHKAALAAFKNQKALLKGRVTNDQLVNLIKFYQGFLESADVSVTVESAPNSGFRLNTKTWDPQSGPDLKPLPGRSKLSAPR